jgi:hypothetical protein
MTVLLVTYDLNKPGQDYEKLLSVIKNYDYVELCKSSYVVDTNKPSEFCDKVSSTLDKTTQLYIFKLTDPLFLEYGDERTGKWLELHLGKRTQER